MIVNNSVNDLHFPNLTVCHCFDVTRRTLLMINTILFLSSGVSLILRMYLWYKNAVCMTCVFVLAVAVAIYNLVFCSSFIYHFKQDKTNVSKGLWKFSP